MTQRASYALGYAIDRWLHDKNARTSLNDFRDLLSGILDAKLTLAAQGDKYTECKTCGLQAKKKDITKNFSTQPWKSSDGSTYNYP